MQTLINLADLIEYIDNYILMKKSDIFPHYNLGDDLDLIVLDKEQCIKNVYKYYQEKIKKISDIQLSIINCNDRCHIDFLGLDDKIIIRLDAIENFNFFKKIKIKNSYITKLFQDKKNIKINNLSVCVPSDEDELTLRYFEYLEYFDTRPDKIKHLDYICQIEDLELKKRFFTNTHNYIKFITKEWDESIKNSQAIYHLDSRKQALKNIMISLKFIARKTFMG